MTEEHQHFSRICIRKSFLLSCNKEQNSELWKLRKSFIKDQRDTTRREQKNRLTQIILPKMLKPRQGFVQNIYGISVAGIITWYAMYEVLSNSFVWLCQKNDIIHGNPFIVGICSFIFCMSKHEEKSMYLVAYLLLIFVMLHIYSIVPKTSFGICLQGAKKKIIIEPKWTQAKQHISDL